MVFWRRTYICVNHLGSEVVLILIMFANWTRLSMDSNRLLMLGTPISVRSFNILVCSSQAEVSLFMFRTKEVVMFLLIYVDDIIVVSSSTKAVDALLSKLRSDSALKDPGPLHFFLGIVVQQITDGLLLTQEKYTKDLLHRLNMQTISLFPRRCRSQKSYQRMRANSCHRRTSHGIAVSWVHFNT